MKNCFYMHSHGIDFIMETEKKNVTDKIALEFINKIQNHFNRFYDISREDIQCVKRHVQRARYKIEPWRGLQYVDIVTPFGTFGCDPCKDILEYTVIF